MALLSFLKSSLGFLLGAGLGIGVVALGLKIFFSRRAVPSGQIGDIGVFVIYVLGVIAVTVLFALIGGIAGVAVTRHFR